MQVSLKTLHALVDVERGAERGGAEVDPRVLAAIAMILGPPCQS